MSVQIEINRVVSWLSGKHKGLVCFEEVYAQLPIHERHDAGLQTVPVENIVGSVGRSRDFDRLFQPRRREQWDRWRSIARAAARGVSLPPIQLYKVGTDYFVVDGHHRVSVARAHEQVFIDAYVTEFETSTNST